MSRYNRSIAPTWRSILAQCVVTVAATFVIVWSLPRGSQSALSFDEGRPWPYSQFIAPYDFPVFKSAEQLQREQDSVMAYYEPYFAINTDVAATQVARFHDATRGLASGGLSPAYRTYVDEHLHAVYSRGIISTRDLQMLEHDSCTMVRIYRGTESMRRMVRGLLTEKTAYEQVLAEADSAGLSLQQLQQLNLNHYIQPNLVYDEAKSDEQRSDLIGSLSPSTGVVYAGQSVIDRGEILTRHTLQILESYYRAQEAHSSNFKEKNLLTLGQALYVLIVLLCLTLYLNLFRRDYLGNLRGMTLLAGLVVTYPLVTYFLVSHTLLTVYIVPYAMLPIIVRVFMDSRTAFMAHAATIMLCAIALRYPYEFIATQCVAGLVAIYSLRELSERSQLFKTSIVVTAAAILFYLSIELLHGHTFLGGDSLTRIDWSIYKHLIISGILLLFAYPLMFLLERAFQFTSNVTLVELSNLNRELLRRLSEVAPGTFQHSIQVSNLAAEVARKIGAKSQLVRTGALYHDIGKMKNPAFFTENQMRGVNPHDKLDYAESARIIIAHVSDGEQMADSYRLPTVIRDFISTHHGHGLVKYFYISAQNKTPDVPVDPALFTYPGRNPQTAEQAILMMTDAVEASARSLKEYTEQSISELVERIVDGQLADGLFTECPLTFQDIRVAKEVFKDKLKTIYHTRISYPSLQKGAATAGTASVAAASGATDATRGSTTAAPADIKDTSTEPRH